MRRVEPPTIPGQLSSSPKRDTPFAGSTMPLPASNSGNISSSESAGNSLERNLKPSEILRQKTTTDIAEAKTFANNRKTTPDMSRFANTPELLEEFGRKIGKSESLEKTKRHDLNASQNSTTSSSSLGRSPSGNSTGGGSGQRVPGYNRAGAVPIIGGASPTGSLNKNNKLAAVDSSSSSGSLEKKTTRSSLQAADAENNAQQSRNMVGSKESLSSQGISEIVGFFFKHKKIKII